MNILRKIVSVHTPASRYLTYGSLFLGLALLFISLQLYLDTHSVLSNKQLKNDGYEYLVVNKRITNAMMGSNEASYFTTSEIEELENQKPVHSLGRIRSNQFPIEASNFGELAFSTQLFFESIPADFLDVQPASFTWKPGENKIPVILSQDFLNLYNFGFALSQGLPQMSQETIEALSFNLRIGNSEDYTAEIVGFSQRYSSVIVPMEFMDYANKKFGGNTEAKVSRVILQTNEADDPQLVKFIRDKNYSTQEDKIKWSKVRSVVAIVFASSGFLGMFILLLCILMLALYLDLMITRASSKLRLLSLLGYKTSRLQKQFTAPVYLSFSLILLAALALTLFVKYLLARYLLQFRIQLPPAVSWQTILVAVLLTVFLVLFLQFKSGKIIRNYVN